MSERKPEDMETGWTIGRYQAVLGVAYFLIVAFWSVGIVFHGAPDESTHFFLLEYLKTYHSLPDVAEPVHAFTGSISGYTWHPGDFWYHGLPFPHVLAALGTSYGFGWIMPTEFGYLAARSCNWLMGAVFVCALFRIGIHAGLPKQAAALTAAIISLIPQVSFVFSYFNSDAYGLMSIALSLSTLFGFLKNSNKITAMHLGASLGLLFMAKLYMLPAVVFILVMLLAHYWIRNRNLAALTPTMLIACMIICAPMLIITYLKFGEISGISGQMAFVAIHKANPAINFGTCYFACPEHFFNIETIQPWLSVALHSYFSVTGWMNVYIPAPYYIGAAIILIAFTLGAIGNTVRSYFYQNTSDFLLRNLLPLLMTLGLFPSIIILSLIASQKSLPQPQGRYLFVTIPFMMILAAIALTYQVRYKSAILTACTPKTAKLHIVLLTIVACWMAWTNLLAWSLNTLSPANIQKSAIGRPVASAVLASDAARELIPRTIDAKHLVERLQFVNDKLMLSVPSGQASVIGYYDALAITADGLLLRGWTYIDQSNGAPSYVIAIEAGKIAGAVAVDVSRPDVAKAVGFSPALRTGFNGTIPLAATSEECSLKLYAVSSTFKIFAMPDVCESIGHSAH
ncbi:hypothetical protein TRP66_16850 [Pseudomonas sp. JDS28PS106]|uniref:glycosyltransferase family 39 protein n=1 Tax=Pseudomonas sp. JDS28PS106 TaxID=2497235 RepID=UPI002FD59294